MSDRIPSDPRRRYCRTCMNNHRAEHQARKNAIKEPV